MRSTSIARRADPSAIISPMAGVDRSPLARAGWLVVGLLAVGVGGIGIVVPGLPSTVFFIIAAWAFSRSSPRLEAWVLGLPTIGRLVQDHRDGLGMPKRAKVAAISMIVVFAGISTWVVGPVWLKLLIAAVGLVGIGYLAFAVPTADPDARPQANSTSS